MDPKKERKLGVYFGSASDLFFAVFYGFLLREKKQVTTGACSCLPPQMSLMASLSNPYIVEYKDGWVDEVQTSPPSPCEIQFAQS
jgi:hypothetical protein